MTNKLVAVFLMCIFLAGAVHMRGAEATVGKFKSCFTACHDECKAGGNGFTFCEMKCDTDCTNKEIADKLSLHL